ncbi:PLP-dependent aminotransferase family protein [Saccharopolyspora sp. K220]|uniref:aminotransferase-like domain-containing protein n=1 Tax=Saccharopolyspora soli TaxID=2926618 RepID=UPI001F5AA296|nr:PLP-dependent aminotransferase family protein [Saccharopolyspora soli]MCI2421773.1 PLP-dependent aminotransferase family protein [Saccharopolyspora soli]
MQPRTVAAGEERDWSGRLARRTAGEDGSITAILALANAPDVLNFSGGFPAPEMFPTEIVGDLATRLFREDAAVSMQYSASQGIESTRDAIAEHLSRIEGRRPSDAELMITSGGIDAVTLISRSMLDPGDVVAVEEPTYLGAVSGFTGWNAVMRGLPMDAEGLVVAELEELIGSGVLPKLLYVIPEYQNPSGRVLSESRRRALIEVCRRHGVLIAEDVAYREIGFTGERLPSLWSMAPDCVVQLGTFSKTFFPGVRLGWAAGPPQVIAQLGVAKQNSDQCAGALGQRLVEAFLRGGHFDGQVRRQREFYRTRGMAMDAALKRHLPDDVTWATPTGGFFCWVGVPGVDTENLAHAAQANQVAFVPGAPFFAERVENHFARFSFSRATEEEIDEGIARIAQAIESLRAP